MKTKTLQLLAAAGALLLGGVSANAQLYWQPQADGDFNTAANWSTTTPGYTANVNTINANWIVATFNTASPAFQPFSNSNGTNNFVARIDITSGATNALTFGGTGSFGVRRAADGVAVQVSNNADNVFSAGIEFGRSGTGSALLLDLNNTGTGTTSFNGGFTAMAGQLGSLRFTAGKWALNGAVSTDGKLINVFGGSNVTLNGSSYAGNSEYRIHGGSTVTVANSNMGTGYFTMGGSLGGAASLYLDGDGTNFGRWVGNGNINASYTQTFGYKGSGTATFNAAGAGNINLSAAGTVTTQFDSGAGTLNINTGIAGGSATNTINKIGAGTVSFGGADANT